MFTRDGGTAPEPDAANVAVNYVDPRFFDTVGIPVVRGRGFREEDAAGDRRVALVSERAARQLWPGQDAIGRRIVNADTGGEPFDVIGVARDAHMGQTPFDRPPFVLYPFGPRLAWSATLHVRTDGPVSAATAMVTETIHRRDPTLAVFGAGSMDAALRSQPLLVIVRLGAAVIASFGMLGLLLAAVGLYGSYRRRQPNGGRSSASAPPSARPPPPSPGSRSVAASYLRRRDWRLAGSGNMKRTPHHLVLHPAVPDPRIHETGYRVGAWRWPRGRFLYGAKSPFFSWTRSPASTPYCETGDSSGERAL